MKIFVAGLSYKTTPVEVREKLAVSRARLPCCGGRLKLRGNLSEVVLLSTCNRVEIYGVSPWIHGRVQQLFQELTGGDFDFTPHLYVKEGAEAAQHLFAVASGLDSLVIGKTEITGPVRSAYEAAKAAGLTGKKMNRLFQTACKVVKQIRTQTGIGRGAASVGSVAVELAEKIFDRDLSAKTVMILGAGKMGEAGVKHLAKRGAQTVLVANRSVERAEKLAREFGGRAVRLEHSAPALTGSIIQRPLTPQEIKDHGITGPNAQVSGGISTVGLGEPVFVDAMVNAAIPPADIIIKTCIIGCRVSKKRETQIRKILAAKRFSQVKLLRAKRHRKKFPFEIVPAAILEI